MRTLTQNQTAEPIVFMLVSSTDHVTPVTGAVATVTASKNGATFAAVAGAVTEIGSGWYKVAGNATDANTLGPLIVHATATGSDPADILYQVVAVNPRDAASFGLSSFGTLNTSIAAVAGNVWTVGTRTLTSGANIVLAKGTGITGFNDITAANVDTTLTSSHGAGAWNTVNTLTAADVWGHSTRTLTSGANIVLAKGTGVTGFNDITAAQVDTQLSGTHGAGSWLTGGGGSLTAADVWSYTTRILTAGTNIGFPTAAQIDTQLSGTHGAGSWLTGASSSTIATDVWAAGTRTLTSGVNISLTKGTGLLGLNDITVASIDGALIISHGSGNWNLTAAQVDTAITASHGGGAWNTVAPSVSDINAGLSSTHGSGSWEDIGSELTAAEVWAYTNRSLTDKSNFDMDDGSMSQIITEIGQSEANVQASLGILGTMVDGIPAATDTLLSTNHGIGNWEGGGTGGGGEKDWTDEEHAYILATMQDTNSTVHTIRVMVGDLASSGGSINGDNIVIINNGNMDNNYSQPTLVLPAIPADFENMAAGAGGTRTDFAKAMFDLLAKATIQGITQTQPQPYDLTAMQQSIEALEAQKIPKMRSVLVTGVSNGTVVAGFPDIGTADYIVVCNIVSAADITDSITFQIVPGSQKVDEVTIRMDGPAVGLGVVVNVIERV